MNNSTLTKIVNCLIEGLIIFFFLVVWLFIAFFEDKNSSGIECDASSGTLPALFFFTSIGLFAVTWFLLKKRIAGIQTKYCVVTSIVYTFIVCFTVYAIMDYKSYYYKDYYEINFSTIPLLWLIMEIFWLVIRYILNSMTNQEEINIKKERVKEEQLVKFSSNITASFKNKNITTEKDDIQTISTEQKYAVVFLIAFIQGASAQSAYSAEANQIVQSIISSLGLSNEEVERVIKASMNRNPDQEIDKAMNNLKRIQNQDFINDLYHKCMRIAKITGQNEIVEIVSNIFEEIQSA